MTERWARVTRGLGAAAVAVFVAAFAHAVGGDGAPSGVALALAFSFSALVCIALSGHRMSRFRIGASVVLSQAAFHALFLLMPRGAVVHAGIGGMQMDVRGVASVPHAALPAPSAMSHSAALPHAAMSMHDGGWMLAAHAAAAVVTTVALIWGEAAFWRLLTSARLVFRRVFGRAVGLGWRIVRAFGTGERESMALVAHFLVTGMRHRGPPRWSAAS
jgi:hypothetical protein